jgi:hypothetical protein
VSALSAVERRFTPNLLGPKRYDAACSLPIWTETVEVSKTVWTENRTFAYGYVWSNLYRFEASPYKGGYRLAT